MTSTLASKTATAAATTSAAATAVDTTTKTHVPGYKLPVEERMEKFDRHKFGLCVSCDAGLDDRADFTRDPVTNTPGLMCNDCVDYYEKAGCISRNREYGDFCGAVF
jgi:hypothetical protein